MEINKNLSDDSLGIALLNNEGITSYPSYQQIYKNLKTVNLFIFLNI